MTITTRATGEVVTLESVLAARDREAEYDNEEDDQS